MFLKRFRFSTDEPFTLILGPEHYRLLADGDGDGGEGGAGGGEGEGGQGGDGAGDEGAKGGEGGQGTGDDEGAKAAAASQDADWRAGLQSDEAKKFANDSPDVDHLVNRALEMRRQLSTAVVPPGKDANPEEVAAYRSKIGVPESPDGYDFKSINDEPTEVDKQFFGVMGKLFHDHNVPGETAKALNEAFNEFSVGLQKAEVDADKEYADESEAALKQLWGAEYDKNVDYANRAVATVFGQDLEEAKHIELKTGRFALDHPLMLRAFAAVGREMAEGGLVPPLSDGDRNAIDDQLTDVRKKIAAAQDEGNSKEANRLYQVEQDLLTKRHGNQPIVGAEGRAA